MGNRRSLALGLVLAAFIVALPILDRGRASSTGACRSAWVAAGSRHDRSGVLAASRDRIVAVGKRGSGCMFSSTTSDKAMLRHVAAGSGAAAFVEDRAGPDRLLVSRADEVLTLPAQGEVTHPAWSSDGRLSWAVDLSRLKVLSPRSTKARTIFPPADVEAVFSPFFASGDRLFAVGAEHVPGIVATEDDFLDNLWRYDSARDAWTKLTSFVARGDTWSVLRTPVWTMHGTYFIRIRGSAGATRPPSFQLWLLASGKARKVRDLPREMYLAGFRNGMPLWNVPDARCGDWGLFAGNADRPERVGCGAVMVDPVARPDPDLQVGAGNVDSDERPQHGGLSSELAVVVGDFPTRHRAREAGHRHGELPSPTLINHAKAPLAVRPGWWALAWTADDATGGADLLARVRAALPGLSQKAWITSIPKGLGAPSR
jgi:hypothetical protein